MTRSLARIRASQCSHESSRATQPAINFGRICALTLAAKSQANAWLPVRGAPKVYSVTSSCSRALHRFFMSIAARVASAPPRLCPAPSNFRLFSSNARAHLLEFPVRPHWRKIILMCGGYSNCRMLWMA